MIVGAPTDIRVETFNSSIEAPEPNKVGIRQDHVFASPPEQAGVRLNFAVIEYSLALSNIYCAMRKLACCSVSERQLSVQNLVNREHERENVRDMQDIVHGAYESLVV